MSNAPAAFDPTSHQPPRLNEFGFNKVYQAKMCDDGKNILGKEEHKVPTNWLDKPGQVITTKSLLEAQRHGEKRPDPSFDLDGDGHVGDRDYFLSKHFDKDGDGKLNAKEKAEAVASIKNGFEKNFFWNVEKSGAQRPYRIMQKRGVFVDAEDYLPVTATYPEHPLSSVVPNVPNVAALKSKRRGEYKQDVIEKSKAHEEHVAKIGPPKNYVRSEFLIKEPVHTSINQRIAEDRQAARKKAGLTVVTQDTKDEIVHGRDSLKWVDQPKFNSKTGLEANRKQNMLEELKLNEANFEKHVDAQARIEQREMCHLRAQHKEYPGMTKKDIDDRRKQEMIEDMTKKYGNQTVGVHGMELPKFSGTEESKAWWKYQPHEREPKFQSRMLLKQSHKYWAQNDKMLLADVTEEQGPQCQFKEVYQAKAGEKDFPDKVNTQKHWNNAKMTKENEYKRDFKIAQRWSEDHKSYQHDSVNRLFDNIVNEGTMKEEIEAYRQKKLANFQNQPQRGKGGRGETSQLQHNMNADRANLNLQTNKARDLVGNIGGKNDRSVSHSRSVLHENSNMMSVDMKKSTASGAHEEYYDKRNLDARTATMNPQARQTLFARITGGKNFSMGGSVNAGKTLASTANQGQQDKESNSAAGATTKNMSMPATSAFRDVLKKGVISGQGMLTC